MITQDIVDFINLAGQSVSFGSTGKNLQPMVGRAFAVRTNKDSSLSFICVGKQWNSHVKNMEDNSSLSVCITYAPTNKSVQLKGKMISVVSDPDLEYANVNMNALREILKTFYGEEASKQFMPFHVGDIVEVNMTVSEIFDQTPGPGAGRKVYPQQ